MSVDSGDAIGRRPAKPRLPVHYPSII